MWSHFITLSPRRQGLERKEGTVLGAVWPAQGRPLAERKTFPPQRGRWPAGPDEGKLAAWFGAPGRRAPQNQVVPGARLGSRAPRKSGAAPVRGRLIAVPTKTGRLFRQPDLPPHRGEGGPQGRMRGRWIEKQSVGSMDAPSSVWPSAIHLPPSRGKVFRGACAGTGAALWFVGRGFPDAPCTVPVRGARRPGAPSPPCVGAASGRPPPVVAALRRAS